MTWENYIRKFVVAMNVQLETQQRYQITKDLHLHTCDGIPTRLFLNSGLIYKKILLPPFYRFLCLIQHFVIRLTFSVVSQNNEPNLALCSPVSEEEDVVLPEHDPWNLVDESTGITEEHQQLTIANKNHNEIVAFSLWDMTRNFRIKVLGNCCFQF